MNGARSAHEGEEVFTRFWWRNLTERPGRPSRRRKDNKIDLQVVGWGAQIGLIWLQIGRGGGHL
jgi:hypothetical protein